MQNKIKQGKKKNMNPVNEEYYNLLKESLLQISPFNFRQFLVQEPHFDVEKKIQILISHIHQGSMKFSGKKNRIQKILDEE